MTATQISAILRQAGFAESEYAPGQSIRFRMVEGYFVRKSGEVVRVDHIPGDASLHRNTDAAQQATADALNNYRKAIEAAGFKVDTLDTRWGEYLQVTENNKDEMNDNHHTGRHHYPLTI